MITTVCVFAALVHNYLVHLPVNIRLLRQSRGDGVGDVAPFILYQA